MKMIYDSIKFTLHKRKKCVEVSFMNSNKTLYSINKDIGYVLDEGESVTATGILGIIDISEEEQ